MAADPRCLPEQIGRLKRRDLEWIFQVNLIFDAPHSSTWKPHHVDLRCIPLLVFGMPEARLTGDDDVINVPPQPGESGEDPRPFDAALELIVDRFIRPGQVVCDPALDGRSSLAKAVFRAGCRFIGADIDNSRIEVVVRDLSASADDSHSDDLEH